MATLREIAFGRFLDPNLVDMKRVGPSVGAIVQQDVKYTQIVKYS
jgi:hypothetical protein